MTSPDEQVNEHVTKWVVAVLIAFVAGAVLAAPLLCCMLPTFSLSHSRIYVRRLSALPQGLSRKRTTAVAAARVQLILSRRRGAVVLIAAVGLGVLGRTGLVVGSVLAGAWHLMWMTSLQPLNVNLARSGVRRVAAEGSALRHAARAAHLESTLLRPVKSDRVPVLHVALLCLIGAGALLVGTGVRTEPLPPSVASAMGFEARKADVPVRTVESPAPMTVTPDAGAVNTPTALPQSPCPDISQVARTFTQGVPNAAGRAMYAAWFKVGAAVIGCPEQPPVRRGRVVVSELSGGQDAPAAVVFGAGRAGIVLSDMHALVMGNLDHLAWLAPRLRWGFGTQQLLHLSDGSCLLAQRYESDAPTLLPAAITHLLLDVASRTGAVPRVIRETLIPGGLLFKVVLLQADSQGEIRSIDALTLAYSDGAALLADTKDRATDSQHCPTSATRLAVVSDALETAAQRH